MIGVPVQCGGNSTKCCETATKLIIEARIVTAGDRNLPQFCALSAESTATGFSVARLMGVPGSRGHSNLHSADYRALRQL